MVYGLRSFPIAISQYSTHLFQSGAHLLQSGV